MTSWCTATISQITSAWAQNRGPEVPILPKTCEVPWSCGVVRRCGNQPSKDRGNGTMAYPKYTEGLEVIPGFHIILPTVHPQLAQTVAPLHQLTAELSEKGKKKKSIITCERWKGECQKSFDELRTYMCASTCITVKPEGGEPGHMWGIWLFRRIFGQNPHCGAPKLGQIRSNILRCSRCLKMSSEK